MDAKSYIISVISASTIVGIVLSLIKTKSAYGVFIKLLAGLFIALTAFAPWKSISLSGISYNFDSWETASANHADSGVIAYTEALRCGIIERTETYILEKASSMGAQLSVTVTLGSDNPPIPVAVTLSGNISPYGKYRMKQIIATDLGIPEDAQTWR